MPTQQDAKLQLWKQRIAKYQQSDLTIAQFCRSLGCSVPTFYQWKRRIEKSATPAFLQIETADSVDTSVEIKLPNGILIRLPIQAIDSIAQILDRVA
jgi:transposase